MNEPEAQNQIAGYSARKGQAVFRPITAEDLEPLKRAAAEDDHAVVYPTHMIERDGEIVGYVSVCATPIVNVWLDSKKVQALDSVRLLTRLEQRLEAEGLRQYIMPCAKDSPFFKRMVRLGFRAVAENVWFLKQLTKG